MQIRRKVQSPKPRYTPRWAVLSDDVSAKRVSACKYPKFVASSLAYGAILSALNKSATCLCYANCGAQLMLVMMFMSVMSAKNSSVANVAPKAVGSALNQLLGIKGASSETVSNFSFCIDSWCLYTFTVRDCFRFFLKENTFSIIIFFLQAFSQIQKSHCRELGVLEEMIETGSCVGRISGRSGCSSQSPWHGHPSSGEYFAVLLRQVCMSSGFVFYEAECPSSLLFLIDGSRRFKDNTINCNGEEVFCTIVVWFTWLSDWACCFYR